MISNFEKFIATLQVEADSITAAAKRLAARNVEDALELLLACDQKIVVVGVGKSGVIGEKISQTLTSTGTSAVYLSASDALHGGLGLISDGDIVLALSNSGETDELLAILPTIKMRSVKLISIVGNPSSTLASRSDVVLDASIDREACPLNLAPTASTTVALAIGDALAMALMEIKGLTPSDFAYNHPAGRLGRRLTTKVSDLMHSSPNIELSATWLDVVKAISQFSLGAVNVVGPEAELLGIVTDGDLRRMIERTPTSELANISASDMMTADPISSLPDMLAYDALRLMEDRPSQISVLPVIDGNGKCVGLLRLHDVVMSGV